MAETINDSIANYILTTISAPSLTDVKYAENIETVFNNINDNFNKLSSTPFLQGADGKSFEHYEAKVYDKDHDKVKNKEKGLTKYGAALLNAVFSDITKEKKVDEIIFTEGNVKDEIYEKIKKVPDKCGVKAINNIYNIDGLLDETIYGYGIKNDAGEFKEDTIVITSLVQLIDSRLAHLGDLETTDDGLYYFRDTSCMLKCVTEKVKVNEEYKINIRFVKMYLVATIYYDNDNDQWAWVINGHETHISATGKKGDDGTSANAWVVKTSTKNDRGLCDITHFYAENSKSELEWIPVGDMKELPADGDYAFVYVDRDVNNSTTPYHKDWTFSTIYVKDKTYRVYYDVDYSISQFMKDVTADDIFGTIGKTATDFSRGIWLRQDEKNVKSDHLHALYSEDGTLKLSCVSNQDMDPTQEIDVIESQQLEVNYDTEIKGNTSIDGSVQIDLPQGGSISVGQDLVYNASGADNVLTMNQTQVKLNSVFTNINSGDITMEKGDLSIGNTLISTSDEIGTTKAYNGDNNYLFKPLSSNVITSNLSAVNIESSNSVSTNVILLPNMIIAPSIALDKTKTKQYFGITKTTKNVSLASGKNTKTIYKSTPINMALKTDYYHQYMKVSNTGHSAATLSKSWDLTYSYTYSPNIDTIKKYAVEIANKNGSSISTDLIKSLACNITVSVVDTPVTLTQVMKFNQPWKKRRSVFRLYKYASSETKAKQIYDSKTSGDNISKYGVWSENSSETKKIGGASNQKCFNSEGNSTPKILISGKVNDVGTSITVFGEGTGSIYAIDYIGVESSNLSIDTLPVKISIEFTDIKIFSENTNKSDKFLLDNTGLYNFIYITEGDKKTANVDNIGWYFREVEWSELKSADKLAEKTTRTITTHINPATLASNSTGKASEKTPPSAISLKEGTTQTTSERVINYNISFR